MDFTFRENWFKESDSVVETWCAFSLLEKESAETSRQLVIARISGLQNLNRTFVDGQERRGAEIDYLKKFGLQFLDAKEDPLALSKFYAQHPRYER